MDLHLTSFEDKAVAAALGRALSQEELAAGAGELLRRYTDRTQLVIGLAGEDGAEPATLDLSLAGDPSFVELVQRVQAALPAASADGRVPDVVLSAGSEPVQRAAMPWLRVEGEELSLSLPVDAGPPFTAMLGHLRRLLDDAALRPTAPLSTLAVLSDVERVQLLEEFNRTAVSYPQRCLHALLAEQAARTPDRVAVSCGEDELTYGELDRRASALAGYLRGRGVGPEVLVGICVERSLEMVIGLLGVLKAGGAYVPIDPAYPAERQAFMLESSQAPLVLTQERLLASLPAGDFRVVCLDRDWDAIAGSGLPAPEDDGDIEKLAYVIYTSGSTGKPKGVQIPHRALVNFLWTMREQPGLTGEDVLVAVTTLSFDIAGLELYLPLLVGAHLIVARQETTDARALSELLDRCAATVMQATPTTWRMLVDSGWAGRPGLKALCGGEALPLSLSDALVARGLELWNMYGPTETTIWSTCKRIATTGEALTIGRPIANTTVYILDQHLQPVPVGVAGELWIGGDGLARGYRGRPDLTEERFVARPDTASLGARIYRTGDLARYRADGEIEFLGRIDHQVKVRGFRIELGEIENTLAAHPAVREAVVVARGQETTEAELAAYVIPSGVPVAATALRRYVAQSLPAYMVPSTVTALVRFPLTPNGKIDRKALPEPERGRAAEQELVEPRTELERRLKVIWERELAIEPIGVTDDFFDLGVTSLAAATLFAAIEHELGDNLPLGAIFRAPTIEALARLLEEGSSSRWTSLVPIQPRGSQTPIFCVHGGAGTILHLAPLARRLGEDQPFYGLQSRGLYGGSPPLPTVEAMARHYLSEMREVHPGGPWRLAGYCFGAIVAYELARTLTAQGEEVELLTMFNGPSPDWIRQWGWYGNQPGWRARHPERRRLTPTERRVRSRRASWTRLQRAARQPRRLLTGALWQLRVPYTRVALALGRPVPERWREEFFFSLHARAERAYRGRGYAGEILVFHGEGLYEDPTLGWQTYTTAATRTFAVPGVHDNNRQAMNEPAVGFVSDQLQRSIAAATR